jgi:hypothetical protein
MDQKAAVDNEFRRGQTRAFWWAFPVFMVAFLAGAAWRIPFFILVLLSGIPALIVYGVKLHGSFNADNVIRDLARSGDVSASGPALPQTPQTQARQQGAKFSTVSCVGRPSVFCTNCGTESPDDSRFCSKCGTRFDVVSAVREPNTVRQQCVRDLLELSEYLAASFVALSGEKSISGVSTQEEAAFETLEDMIHSGFMPRYGLSAQLSLTPPGRDAVLDKMRKQFDPAFIDATAAEIRRDELFGPAFGMEQLFFVFVSIISRVRRWLQTTVIGLTIVFSHLLPGSARVDSGLIRNQVKPSKRFRRRFRNSYPCFWAGIGSTIRHRVRTIA